MWRVVVGGARGAYQVWRESGPILFILKADFFFKKHEKLKKLKINGTEGGNEKTLSTVMEIE